MLCCQTLTVNPTYHLHHSRDAHARSEHRHICHLSHHRWIRKYCPMMVMSRMKQDTLSLNTKPSGCLYNSDMGFMCHAASYLRQLSSKPGASQQWSFVMWTVITALCFFFGPTCLVLAHVVDARSTGHVAWFPSLRLIFKHSDKDIKGKALSISLRTSIKIINFISRTSCLPPAQQLRG